MFLDATRRRNPAFIEAVVALHQQGAIPAGSYALDLDAIGANARAFAAEAARLGLTTFAMTKQLGRNPAVFEVLRDSGIPRFVAVDMACARRVHASAHHVGHIGHLTQVPRSEGAAAAALGADFWTVFSDDKAAEAAGATARAGRVQPLLARIQAPGDIFYPGHEGGYPAVDVVGVADRIDGLEGARFAGITTFPALLFDAQAGEVRPTPNMTTLARAASALRAAGRDRIEINAPGTTSTAVLSLLAEAGATQVEPGHGLSGTTPLHAVRHLVEEPSAVYVTEISHQIGGRSFVFGNGFYIDPVFPDYEVHALVGREERLDALREVPALVPPPGAIDYYGQLEDTEARTGDTAVFAFRIQAFFRRAFVVPIRGIRSNRPQVAGVWTTDGGAVQWPM
jgi:predicted amino acid racemase